MLDLGLMLIPSPGRREDARPMEECACRCIAFATDLLSEATERLSDGDVVLCDRLISAGTFLGPLAGRGPSQLLSVASKLCR